MKVYFVAIFFTFVLTSLPLIYSAIVPTKNSIQIEQFEKFETTQHNGCFYKCVKLQEGRKFCGTFCPAAKSGEWD